MLGAQMPISKLFVILTPAHNLNCRK